MNASLKDPSQRPLRDLRISVIDRCNYRCPYCMPKDTYSENYKFLNKEDWLSFEEIIRLVKVFVNFGVRKVRLTGGEPLLRPNIHELIQELASIDNVDDIALTTNGSLLTEHAEKLRKSGLKRLTVSIDALNKDDFNHMSGGKGRLEQVLQGIQSAENAGFSSIKINTVIQRNVNENAILDLVNKFRNTSHVVRFIEYMDVGTCNAWNRESVVTSAEIRERIHTQFPLVAESAHFFGEVAQRYSFKDGGGEIGFISSVSQPFCGSCTRLRLSADGQLYTCLFSNKGHNLKPLLKNNPSNKDLKEFITQVWSQRQDHYSEVRYQTSPKPDKIEMFHIGG